MGRWFRVIVAAAAASVVFTGCGRADTAAPPLIPPSPQQATSAQPTVAAPSTPPGSAPSSSVSASSAAATSASPRSSTAPSPQPAASAPPLPPGVTVAPTAPAKRIGPLLFISQTLNNCGPASVAEVLDFWGVHRTQAQVASVLRPSLPDYGMSLYGVPFYAESVGMKTLGGVGASDDLLKALISNGIPVIVADYVSSQERIRHFRPIDGYNDAEGYFIGSDPYLGPNHKISYAEFDDIWKVSQSQFIAIFPPDKQPLVEAVAAQHWNRAASAQAQVSAAQKRINQQPRIGWGWMGLADAQIQTGDYAGAAESIEKATQAGPAFEAHWLQLKLERAQQGNPISS